MFESFFDAYGNCCKYYNSYEDLLDELKPGKQLCQFLKNGIFRGQALDWKLLPSLYRRNNDGTHTLNNYFSEEYFDGICNQDNLIDFYNKTEYAILRNFYIKANNNGLNIPHSDYLSNNYLQDDMMDAINRIGGCYDSNSRFFTDKNFLELAALAQHYGMKTRLLDWSYNFYVALYFAASGALNEFEKGNCKQDDYMIVWCLPSNYIYAKASNLHIPPIKIIVPDYSKNPNIRSQKGVLTYWNLYNNDDSDFFDPFDIKIQKFNKNEEIGLYDFKFFLSKIFIPIKECTKILKHLKTMGYSSNIVYPWFDGIKKDYDEMLSIIKFEKQKIESSKENIYSPDTNTISLPLCNYKVSAGCGFDFDYYDEWETIEVECTSIAEKADFCLEVEGNSMEPDFSNGDIVLVRKDDTINIGEIGIFSKNNQGYIKKRGADRWISLNPDYEDVYIEENDIFRFFGKVIGKAKILSIV